MFQLESDCIDTRNVFMGYLMIVTRFTLWFIITKIIVPSKVSETLRLLLTIPHIYHGKSTHKVSLSGENAQSLDTLSMERERGITVKAQGAALFYNHNDQGHVEIICSM
eukprot:995038_1